MKKQQFELVEFRTEIEMNQNGHSDQFDLSMSLQDYFEHHRHQTSIIYNSFIISLLCTNAYIL